MIELIQRPVVYCNKTLFSHLDRNTFSTICLYSHSQMCKSFKRENSIFKKNMSTYIYIPKQILKKEYTWLKSWNTCTCIIIVRSKYIWPRPCTRSLGLCRAGVMKLKILIDTPILVIISLTHFACKMTRGSEGSLWRNNVFSLYITIQDQSL